MISYIASDLDGTLLQNGAQSLNPEIFDLILQLKEKGIHFIASSGRPYSSLRRLFDPIKDDISYVAENGSLCIHNGEVISRGEINRDLGLRILDSLKDFPSCDCFVSGISTSYVTSKNAAFIDHMENVIHYNLTHIDNWDEINEPFLKIAMCDFNGTEDMASFFRKRFADEIKTVTSGNIWLDFVAPNANKGTGLASILSHLNLDPKDGLAFGDQYNDVEMLQLAGTSYAMSNAAPGIAYYSDYVTDSVADVLYDILAQV